MGDKNIVLGMFVLPTASFYCFVCLVQKIRLIVGDTNRPLDYKRKLSIFFEISAKYSIFLDIDSKKAPKAM